MEVVELNVTTAAGWFVELNPINTFVPAEDVRVDLTDVELK